MQQTSTIYSILSDLNQLPVFVNDAVIRHCEVPKSIPPILKLRLADYLSVRYLTNVLDNIKEVEYFKLWQYRHKLHIIICWDMKLNGYVLNSFSYSGDINKNMHILKKLNGFFTLRGKSTDVQDQFNFKKRRSRKQNINKNEFIITFKS